MSDTLDQIFENLSLEADSRDVNVDPSFFVELRNYSRHIYVDELPEEDLTKVIYQLGKVAIETAAGRVGGGAVRYVITQICHDAFSDCYKAALNILGR